MLCINFSSNSSLDEPWSIQIRRQPPGYYIKLPHRVNLFKTFLKRATTRWGKIAERRNVSVLDDHERRRSCMPQNLTVRALNQDVAKS